MVNKTKAIPALILAMLLLSSLIGIALHLTGVLDSASAALRATQAAQASKEASSSEARIMTYPQVIHSKPKLWITPQRYVKTKAYRAGYDHKQLSCLFEIIDRESRWSVKAANPKSSAYGLFQQLKLKPGTKLSKQVELGLKYINHRYGTACQALEHHNKRGWY
jgi:hypothetical protein